MNTIASATNDGGEILWNALLFAAKSIWSQSFCGYDNQEISSEESDDDALTELGDIDIESFYSVSGSTDGDGETVATTLENANANDGSLIYIDTINVYNYNYCEMCQNKS